MKAIFWAIVSLAVALVLIRVISLKDLHTLCNHIEFINSDSNHSEQPLVDTVINQAAFSFGQPDKLSQHFAGKEIIPDSILFSVGEFVKEMPLDWREGYGNHLPFQLTFAFPITMINHSCKPYTLVDYELSPYNADYDYTFRPQDGDQGLYNHYLDSLPITLPISIHPGEGKTFFLKTAIVIPDLYLPYELERTETNPSVEDLIMYYAIINEKTNSGSLDLFGNVMDISIGARGLLDLGLKEKSKIIQPIYYLRFISAYNEYFDTHLSPYPLDWSEPFVRCSELIPYDRSQKVLQVNDEEYLKYLENKISPRRRIVFY